MNKIISFLLVVSLFTSCTKKTYDNATCSRLSMDSFKGSPKALNEFEKHCKNAQIAFTHENCQNALNDLIMSASLSQVVKKYGAGVEGCFTENDLIKFNK